MRNLVILIILGAAAYFGWKYFMVDEPTPAEGPTTTTDSSDGGPDEGFPAGISEGGSTPPVSDPGALPEDLAKRLAAAEQQWQDLKNGGLDPAACEHSISLARTFSEALRATYGKPALKDLGDRLVASYLNELGGNILMGRQRYPKDGSGLLGEHVVTSGQTLNPIGKQHGLSYQYLNMLRGRVNVEDSDLRIGERLKIVNAKEKGYFIHIDKSAFHLDLYVADVFARRYPIAIGAPGMDTPVGETFIEAREREPTWYHPETNEPIPYGHPSHVIGPVWLRLNADGIGKQGIGIHGYTGEGPAVGVKASNGCIRMRNDDAKQVFNVMVPCLYDSDNEFITRAPMKVVIVE